MITRLNTIALKVLDQDEALDFYVNKLGLEVAQDFRQGPVRWLTVKVPGDGGPEIYLEEPGPPVTGWRPLRSGWRCCSRPPSSTASWRSRAPSRSPPWTGSRRSSGATPASSRCGSGS